MASDFFRDSIRFLAWSGSETDLERLLTVAHSRLREDFTNMVENAKKRAEGTKRADDQSYWPEIEAELNDRIYEIKESLELHAEILTGTRRQTSVGDPKEIASRLNPRMRQTLEVRCPGGSVGPGTGNSVRISLSDRDGVDVHIEGSEEDWVRGTYDRLHSELKNQVPGDAWIRSRWTTRLLYLIAGIVFCYFLLMIPSSPLLAISLALAVAAGLAATIFLISRFRSFELVPAGKTARSARSLAVIIFLIGAPFSALIDRLIPQ